MDEVINYNELILMLARFFFNLFFIGIIIKIIHSHSSEISRHDSTFFIISVIVFFLCFTLKQIDLNFGMALGLFAIFGIIRYRTEAVLPEEITYLFVTIGLSVINALTSLSFGWLTLLTINVLVCFAVLFAEKFLFHADDVSDSHRIVLNIPIQHNEMNSIVKNEVEKISKNLNINVINYNINRIDYKGGIVNVHIFYHKDN